MISLEIKNPIICKEIEEVVSAFCMESNKEDHSVKDLEGLFQQTMTNIGDIIINKPMGRFLWLDVDEVGRVIAYVLTHVSRDVDNQFCYYMTQAWLHPKYRCTKYAKQAVSLLRDHAKQMLCKHIVVVSSRNNKAYIRFLGGNFHKYVMLLKEDI